LIDHAASRSRTQVSAIYWNSSVAGSTATSTTTAALREHQAEIDDFITNFPDNTNWDNSSTATTK